MSTCIIVDNLPVVPEAKVGKLRTFVEKIFAQVAPIVNMSMPMTAAGMSEGYALIEYPKADDATKAVASTNGYDFDKSHKLIVNHFGDFRRFAAVPEVYAEPARVALETADDLNDWLLDAAVRDEYVVRHESETEVYWSDNAGPPVPDYCGEREKREGKTWTEREVMWSPHGTYLLTFHAAGVALWGGKNFRKLARFPHPDVSHAAFSPDERLLATWNGMPENDAPDDALIVWDARTGQQLRTFKQVCGVVVVVVCVCVCVLRAHVSSALAVCTSHAPRAAAAQLTEDGRPDFYWSHDGKYLARPSHDAATGVDFISVYTAPEMALLDKRSIKAAGSRDLSWSPQRANVLAWWAPESLNSAACVTLMAIPERSTVRQKNLFNVKECVMHWQSAGDFLCVQVTRLTKSKKRTFTNFELFRTNVRARARGPAGDVGGGVVCVRPCCACVCAHAHPLGHALTSRARAHARRSATAPSRCSRSWRR